MAGDCTTSHVKLTWHDASHFHLIDMAGILAYTLKHPEQNHTPNVIILFWDNLVLCRLAVQLHLSD
jgi:hypothetical protein